jgi:transketolase
MMDWKLESPRDAFGKKLAELGAKNKNIVVLCADLSSSTKTSYFEKKFPERFFNFGIAEQNMFATAAGLALSGKIVVASTFAVFASGRALDQVRQSVAYQNLNVKIIVTHSGITVGADGASHQCVDDLGIMTTLPNMRVIVPCDAIETTKAVDACIAHEGPFYIRLGRPEMPTITKEVDVLKLGKGVVMREGKDITLIATGIMVSRCLLAAQKLANRGISARVLNIHTIKPIDEKLILKAATETNAIITAEEHNIYNGLGSMVCAVVCKERPVKVERISIPDTFGESGSVEELMKKYGLTVENIVNKAVKLVKKK